MKVSVMEERQATARCDDAVEQGEKEKKKNDGVPSSLFLPSFTYGANSRVAETDFLTPGAEFFTKGLLVGAIRGHSGSSSLSPLVALFLVSADSGVARGLLIGELSKTCRRFLFCFVGAGARVAAGAR